MATLLEEDKISLDALCNILKSASLGAEILNGRVYLPKVNPSDDPRALSLEIELHKPDRFLLLIGGSGLGSGNLDAFINRLNLNELVPSFSWFVEEDADQGTLTARYFMSIAGGLIDEQLVSMVRRLSAEVTDGITKYDTDKLVI